MSTTTQQPKLERTTFTFSRALEYFDINELQAQTGQAADNFPSVVVKELVDNALDECESLDDVIPEVKLTVNEVDGEKLQIKVSDNGKGISSEVVDKILDFNTRTTSKAFYRTPTRGQLGNALKTIFGIPFALAQISEEDNSEVEPIIIESQGIRHVIAIKSTPIGEPDITNNKFPININTGTSFTVTLIPAKNRYGRYEPYTDYEAIFQNIEKLCVGYGVFNPNIVFCFKGRRDIYNYEEDTESELTVTHSYSPLANSSLRKFCPTDLPSPYWFGPDNLKKLIHVHIKNKKIKPFGEFIRKFRGLSSSIKAKKVKAEFADVRTIADIDEDRVPQLLKAMQAATKPPAPSILGIIGEENLKQRIASIYEVEHFWYERINNKRDDLDEELPFIVEVAAATIINFESEYRKNIKGRTIITGLNFSPTYDDPFKDTNFSISKKECFYGSGLAGFLSSFKIGSNDKFLLVLHVTTPALEFRDRAKSTVFIPPYIKNAIADAVFACCREFYEHKRREEKDALKEERRQKRDREETESTAKKQKLDLKEVVFEVMPEAINKVSGGDRFPFPNRNLFYVLRDLVKGYNTNKELTGSYCSRLVKDYQKLYSVIPGLYYEARGEFIEPHTEIIIPLGTREVNNYDPPKYLFNKILYIEKRGFKPLFKAVQLAEKYDMGIASSQGYAVDACKELLEKANRKKQKIPILCLHDCDGDGLMIAETLKKSIVKI